MLEKIVGEISTPLRISPGGLIGLASGLPITTSGMFLLSKNDMPAVLGFLALAGGYLSLGYGIFLCYWGLKFYSRAKRVMSYPTANSHMGWIVRSSLGHYCTRHAYHAAAVRLGFGKEYDAIKAKNV